VSYVGSVTRYIVDLDLGGSLLAEIANTGVERRGVGQAVTLTWNPMHEYRVPN